MVRVAQGAKEAHWKQWSIVVASMRDKDGTEVMARRHRTRLPKSMPIDIVTATPDEGLRHRVVVGEFENKSAARWTLLERAADFPSEARTLRLEQSTSTFEDE